MPNRPNAAGLVSVAAAILIANAPAIADTVVTLREGTIVGQAAASAPPLEEGKLVKLWNAADRMARVDGAHRMVTRLDRGETYIVNTAAGTCFLITHAAGGGAAVATTHVFQPTGDTRRFGDWTARGYELTAAGEDALTVRVWVSEDVDVDIAAQRQQVSKLVTPETAWALTMFDLGGYPVRQESRIGPVYTWSQVVSVGEAEPPRGTYDKPSDIDCKPL